MVKIPSTNAGGVRDAGLSPGSGAPLEKGMAAHFSVLAWRIPWTEEPDWLQAVGSQESDTTERLSMNIMDKIRQEQK